MDQVKIILFSNFERAFFLFLFFVLTWYSLKWKFHQEIISTLTAVRYIGLHKRNKQDEIGREKEI